MNWHSGTRIALLLVVVAVCLFEYILHWHSGNFREVETALLQEQWTLLICLAVWCGGFLFLELSLVDLPLIVLLLIAITACIITYAAQPNVDATTLLAGVTLGKAMRFAMETGSQRSRARSNSEVGIRRSEAGIFLIGLVLLLAFASWWHLNMLGNCYTKLRWMGLWNNPNDYGLLMGAGGVLAIGLLAGVGTGEWADRRWKIEDGGGKNWKLVRAPLVLLLQIFLFIAAGMMGTGLIFSYSRGAWVGTAIGLMYLATVYGKFKWRYVVPGIVVATVAVWFFWNATPDSAPWYVKRLDLGRPSAQHRVAAWKAGFEMMRDHPFGVGWSRAVEIYQKQYSPPEDGAAAIATNDYLMLGVQLGWPGLICFVAYATLCLGVGNNRTRQIGNRKSEIGITKACKASALAMLMTFWFDGGLFKLATGTVFWILLELGKKHSIAGPQGGAVSDSQRVVATN